MSQREGWNMCRIISWVLAAVVGILVIRGIIGSVGFIAAVMAGAALAVFIGLVLTRLFCMKQGAGAAMVPTAEAAKESAADAAQATSRAAADAGAKAKETAAEAGAKAKEVAADAGAKAKETAAEAGAKAKETAEDTGAKAKETADDVAAKAGAGADGETAAKAEDDAGEKAATAAAKPTAEPAAKPAEATEGGGTRPEALSAPKGGKADNLKEIKGVGPKLETLLNEMGFYHFDQIASWGPDEVAWVDGNIKGFKGRVSRDNWVEQAKVLASGGETEFSKRVDDGDVY
ncbi:MAG: NADH:ubiquinone oxidoreductase [Pseudomonadota bacterium]|uniref:NADH:ubiquinone oxidoreductase n=1 Tax=Roseovarius TaxID=74030 RepID=UPI0022A8CF4A|nr:NADH:ubiquinone oxidoreductase [Roseovarius sp. EGI FJ00037]MCZ0811919.1 NADH:ubiquinone oxidoreductase [Roseovarius sp. EGI FJ00037]